MYPHFDIGPLEIPTYGLISVLGIAVMAAVLCFLAKRREVSFSNLSSTALFATVGVLLGARLLYSITRIEALTEIVKNYELYESTWDFSKALLKASNGLVFYGGLYGGLLFGFLWAKKSKYPAIGDMADLFAVGVPLFHIFGRVGCFFAGCCYGVPWEHGIAGRVIGSGMRETVKRFPVQLVEAGVLLILTLVMIFLYLKPVLRGKLMLLYLGAYAVIRFTLEFFRGDEIRGKFLIFSTSQWISIFTLIGVIVFAAAMCIKKKKSKT
ncbi:MAG: prolipoprotein diacylglyceryl transferase [Ruminococcus sp.]